jgi:hypothetical protein
MGEGCRHPRPQAPTRTRSVDGDRSTPSSAASARAPTARARASRRRTSPASSGVEARVCEQAGVDPVDVDLIECHGTSHRGRRQGRGRGAQPRSSAAGTARPERGPVRIGSVKSMIGHLKSAAGAASLHQDRAGAAPRRLPAIARLPSGAADDVDARASSRCKVQTTREAVAPDVPTAIRRCRRERVRLRGHQLPRRPGDAGRRDSHRPTSISARLPGLRSRPSPGRSAPPASDVGPAGARGTASPGVSGCAALDAVSVGWRCPMAIWAVTSRTTDLPSLLTGLRRAPARANRRRGEPSVRDPHRGRLRQTTRSATTSSIARSQVHRERAANPDMLRGRGIRL